MGGAKREMERQQELEAHASEILLEAGAFRECRHGTLMRNYDDEAERRAYATATVRERAGMVDGSRQEILDAIKARIDDTGEDCYSCDKERDE